mmetsp:Transcript_12462/g.34324  ORF Transcript_12462/g.34324 Transcript_12462/m.34324 type:complete len:538 (-) Transcript_12462:119-1732(-)
MSGASDLHRVPEVLKSTSKVGHVSPGRTRPGSSGRDFATTETSPRKGSSERTRKPAVSRVAPGQKCSSSGGKSGVRNSSRNTFPKSKRQVPGGDMDPMAPPKPQILASGFDDHLAAFLGEDLLVLDSDAAVEQTPVKGQLVDDRLVPVAIDASGDGQPEVEPQLPPSPIPASRHGVTRSQSRIDKKNQRSSPARFASPNLHSRAWRHAPARTPSAGTPRNFRAVPGFLDDEISTSLPGARDWSTREPLDAHLPEERAVSSEPNLSPAGVASVRINHTQVGFNAHQTGGDAHRAQASSETGSSPAGLGSGRLHETKAAKLWRRCEPGGEFLGMESLGQSMSVPVATSSSPERSGMSTLGNSGRLAAGDTRCLGDILQQAAPQRSESEEIRRVGKLLQRMCQQGSVKSFVVHPEPGADDSADHAAQRVDSPWRPGRQRQRVDPSAAGNTSSRIEPGESRSLSGGRKRFTDMQHTSRSMTHVLVHDVVESAPRTRAARQSSEPRFAQLCHHRNPLTEEHRKAVSTRNHSSLMVSECLRWE